MKAQDKRREKINKMFPTEVKLGLCPKCGKHAVVKHHSISVCLKCDYMEGKQ